MEIIRDIPFARYPHRAPLLLDLRLPPAPRGRIPAIIWLQGGGWTAVSRQSRPDWADVPGAAVAAIDYRGSDEAIAPANVHDCKAAVRWVRANADQYGLDPLRIGVLGGSAGGHLAAMLAVTPGVPELEGAGGNPEQSTAVHAVCNQCGPSDLGLRMALPEYRKNWARLYEVTQKYLGGPVEERLELARLVSPLRYVTARCPPMLIQHVRGDPVVPLIESQELFAALKAAGADVKLDVVEGNTHGWDRSLTRASMLDFFRRTLSLES